jgi:oxygen-independent coproporphyrinogen-3 oxidase
MAYLVAKYNQPVPRYTSYPTVPYWQTPFDAERWKAAAVRQFNASNHAAGISLYIHLPFCESLCTYCGCNKKITTNHGVEGGYLDALEKEWQLYLQMFPAQPVIRELHLGGGTPTFFSPANLRRLVKMLWAQAIFHEQAEMSIEGHPNNTNREHLETLYELGFRRISYGVQDNDPEVQRIINRIQPLENVQRATEEARRIGFESVNYDLIYGLPGQTLKGLEQTVKDIITLRPDRIAFYSYAHVPWTSRGQRLFDEQDLPTPEEKMALYLKGRELLTDAGYGDIGMDHYAMPNDTLYQAWQNGSLHRNFMGYTTQHTSLLIGLGVSSISDAGVAFAQNHKALSEYYQSIEAGELAVFKGYALSEEDETFRRYILDVCCKGAVQFDAASADALAAFSFPELEKLEADGLVTWNERGATVTKLGRNFIRNIARCFDLHLLRSNAETSSLKFSKAV